MTAVHIWLREETKPFEHRVAFTPSACAVLIQAGFTLTVEKMSARCVPDEEYAAVGCTMVDGGTWTSAPPEAFIVGLKELPEDGSALTHRHIFFAHCFKEQGGWREILGRFTAGGGSILDLEFLADDKGRRVAAFGYMAGFGGAAVGLQAWCAQTGESALGSISPYPNENALIEELKAKLEYVREKGGRGPRVLVIGALGRCGTGAVTLCQKAGIPDADIVKWDIAETKCGGPFPALLECDVFVNCIYLSTPIPPFLTQAMLDDASRKLSVIVDVSCDTSNPHNPLPFCNVGTTFSDPVHRITPSAGSAVDVVSIDHLPTMLPLESSEHYARDLLPTILELAHVSTNSVWVRAAELFAAKVHEAEA